MARSPERETIGAKRQRRLLTGPACEGCRVRKVRCDRASPCSNCKISGISCEPASSSAAGRASPGGLNELHELSQKVKHLEQRLLQMQQLLDSQQTTTQPRNNECRRNDEENPKGHSETISRQIGSLYEGDSSFAAEVSHATRTSQVAAIIDTMEKSNLDSGPRKFEPFLSTPGLRLKVEDYQFTTTSAAPIQDNRPALPMNLISTVLAKIEEKRPIFLSSWLIQDRALVENVCLTAYSPLHAPSSGCLATMHGLLYCILREFLATQNEVCEEFDLRQHVSTCNAVFNARLQSFETLAVPTFENIFTLALGIIKAQEEDKLFLSSTLIASAASQCQTLGYHREATYQSLDSAYADRIRRVFWTIYVFDRNMALLLGRAANIPEYEVDLEYPALTQDPNLRPWNMAFILAIRLAKAQGSIYERLYSPKATELTKDQRELVKSSLVVELRQWRSDFDKIDFSKTDYPEVFFMSKQHWDIMYHSTLTTLLRASLTEDPARKISSECFQAAEATLKCYLRCFETYRASRLVSDADFSNWILHYSSFTSYVIVFLHAVTWGSLESVQLLDQVVEVLQALKTVSRSSQILFENCSTLRTVAEHAVKKYEAPGGSEEWYDQPDDALEWPGLFTESFEATLATACDESNIDDVQAILAQLADEQCSPMELLGASTKDV